MGVEVRTRGEIATFKVDCVNQETHIFTVSVNGSVVNLNHDLEADAVMDALGAEQHPCAKAFKVFEVASVINNAETGVKDYSEVKFFSQSWSTNDRCESCSYRNSNMQHIHSVTHLTAAFGIENLTNPVNTVLRWLRRNDTSSKVFKTIEEISEAYPTLNTNQGRHYLPNSIKKFIFTPEFIEAGMKIFGNDFKTIYQLRTIYGIKVQWLKNLSESLTRKAINRIREEPKIGKVLSGARNINSTKVAEFLNAGIYANIYTYIKNNATPADALTVYKATSGDKTLAEMLKEGHSIPGAVQSVASA